MKIKVFSLSLITTLLAFISCPLLTYAAGPSIYATSNSSSVASGGSFVVAVYMDGGGQPINAVEANLTYPANQLQYVGLNYSGSPFSISTPGDGGGSGSVSIQNGTISPVTGSALIATVTFRALVGSGSASVSVSSSSQLISATTNTGISFTPSGVSVNFGASASHSSSSSSAASTPAPKPVVDPTPTVITDVKTSNVSPTSATITWVTNNPADSVVDFGLDSNYGLSGSSSTMTTSHSVQLNGAFLLPETTLHYKVQSTDQSGNVTSSPDKTLDLPGVPITIIVYSPSGSPQPNAQVTIDNVSGTTNAHGSVTLTTGYGDKSITTNYQGVIVTKPISVSPKTKPLTTYQLDLAKQPLNHWMITSLGLIVVVLALLAVDGALFGSRLASRLINLTRHKSSPKLASSPAAVSKEPELADIKDQDKDVEFDLPDTTNELASDRLEVNNKLDGQLTTEQLNDLMDLDKPVPSADSFLKTSAEINHARIKQPHMLDVKAAPPLTIKITDESDSVKSLKIKKPKTVTKKH